MRCLLLIYFLLSTAIIMAQDTADYINTISEEDSIVIVQWRAKMAQYINPKPDSAFYYSRKIKDFTVALKYGPGIVDADYLIGQCFKRLQQNDSAIAYFKNTLELSKSIDYPIGAARAYNSLCRTYYLLGEMEASIEACQNAIATTRLFDDPNNMIFADSHTALATAYARQNRLEEAIKALLVVDSVQNVESLRPDVIAAAYQNLGNIYLDLKDYNASEAYYLKANDEFKKLPGNTSYYLNTTHINLGRVYRYKEDFIKADSLLTLSYDFFSSLNDERTVAEISTYIGEVKREQGEYNEAERYFAEGLEIHKRNKRNYEASQNALELAQVALKKNSAATALRYLDESIAMNESVKNSLVSQQAYELYSEAYALQNNYRNAYEYKAKAQKIKDSLQSVQSSEKIKEIEAIYQTERRDREIELLTSQNALREQQNKNQRNIFLGGIALTTLAGIFFYIMYRNRQRTNTKLKELDKAKSTFFANISHDFRTPLTLIKGPIEDQLDDEELSMRERKNLLLAKSNTERLESLVEQLLALSKLESGNLELKVRPGNLANFIAAQLASFEFAAKERNITLSLEQPHYEDVDWFDRDAMEKILFNLLGNAYKYCNDGGKLSVRGRKENESFKLEVSNSGAFLDSEQIEKIFHRFYQADPELSGSGIGLALTKELTELHKGSITAVSEEGGWTTFRLSIPISKSAYDDHEILSEVLRETETTSSYEDIGFQDLTLEVNDDAPLVLIVDDNTEIRTYLKSILELSYRVVSASDGQKGIDLATSEIPDLIISDVMMPDVNGYELTRQIKSNELTSHIPLLLLTAKSEDQDKLTGMELGADAYLTKPFSSQLLLANLANLIDNRRKLQARFAQEVILKPKDISISSADELFLERLQKVMDEHITNPQFTSEQFAKEMSVSRMQLHRKLKAITGQSTTEFLRGQRLKLAANLLRQGKGSISEIGYTVGFNDPSYFTKCFKQEFGCAPSDFISG